MAPTSTASAPARVSGVIPATTPTSRPAPGSPARWPNRAVRWRWCRPATRAFSADGNRSARGSQTVAGSADPGHPRDDRGASGRQPGRRAVGPRLRGHLAVGPAQAVGCHRDPSDRRGQRRSGAGHLQPGLQKPHLAGRVRDLLLEHRDPGTPVVIGRDVLGPREEVKVVRLADLDPADVDMRCLLIIRSSRPSGTTTGCSPRAATPPRI